MSELKCIGGDPSCATFSRLSEWENSLFDHHSWEIIDILSFKFWYQPLIESKKLDIKFVAEIPKRIRDISGMDGYGLNYSKSLTFYKQFKIQVLDFNKFIGYLDVNSKSIQLCINDSGNDFNVARFTMIPSNSQSNLCRIYVSRSILPNTKKLIKNNWLHVNSKDIVCRSGDGDVEKSDVFKVECGNNQTNYTFEKEFKTEVKQDDETQEIDLDVEKGKAKEDSEKSAHPVYEYNYQGFKLSSSNNKYVLAKSNNKDYNIRIRFEYDIERLFDGSKTGSNDVYSIYCIDSTQEDIEYGFLSANNRYYVTSTGDQDVYVSTTDDHDDHELKDNDSKSNPNESMACIKYGDKFDSQIQIKAYNTSDNKENEKEICYYIIDNYDSDSKLYLSAKSNGKVRFVDNIDFASLWKIERVIDNNSGVNYNYIETYIKNNDNNEYLMLDTSSKMKDSLTTSDNLTDRLKFLIDKNSLIDSFNNKSYVPPQIIEPTVNVIYPPGEYVTESVVTDTDIKVEYTVELQQYHRNLKPKSVKFSCKEGSYTFYDNINKSQVGAQIVQAWDFDKKYELCLQSLVNDLTSMRMSIAVDFENIYNNNVLTSMSASGTGETKRNAAGAVREGFYRITDFNYDG